MVFRLNSIQLNHFVIGVESSVVFVWIGLWFFHQVTNTLKMKISTTPKMMTLSPFCSQTHPKAFFSNWIRHTDANNSIYLTWNSYDNGRQHTNTHSFSLSICFSFSLVLCAKSNTNRAKILIVLTIFPKKSFTTAII